MKLHFLLTSDPVSKANSVLFQKNSFVHNTQEPALFAKKGVAEGFVPYCQLYERAKESSMQGLFSSRLF